MEEDLKEGAYNVPKWFVTFITVAVSIILAMLTMGTTWLYDMSLQVNTLTVQMDSFNSVKAEVEDMKRQLKDLQLWKASVNPKIQKLP